MRETTSYFAQQALHWGHLVAKNDLDFVTTLLTLDHNWYHNFNPPNGPFPDSYVITHFKVDTITYKEPTLSTKLTLESITTIKTHLSDPMNIHNKSTPLLATYKSPQCSHKLHHLHHRIPQSTTIQNGLKSCPPLYQ